MDAEKKKRREQYREFCRDRYVPIFSQSWWLDAVCMPDNWDVWLCFYGDEIVAGMPYYMEERNGFRYIAKAPLTQNNGIIFAHGANSTSLSRQKSEERIVNEACDFIQELGVDVYEQQFLYDFNNWSPFYWNGYEATPRYTYVIEDTSDLSAVKASISRTHRKNIRKGTKNGILCKELHPDLFFQEHEKIFAKQGLPCPFSKELWLRLYKAVRDNGSGEILYATDQEGNITSLMFLVWDGRSAYPLLGGSVPEFQNLETYSMVTWESIKIAHEKGLAYDLRVQ